jgi:hypothetical protein
MPLLEIQKYLRSGKTLIDLESEFGIEHTKDLHMVSLNYNMISSPMKEKICQECRGLILSDGTWDILAYPFYKFFNMGEGFQAEIDWTSARYMEKLDGSMLLLWFDPTISKWNFATRSMPRASGKVNGASISFSDLAWMALKNVLNNDVEDFLVSLNPRLTYIFELTSPYNRIVCAYNEPKLTLIGVRDLDTLNELSIEPIAEVLGLTIPPSYGFATVEDMIAVINKWNPVEHEGIVVVDKHFNRVKVKNIAYCAMHGAISSLSASDRNLMKLIMLGQADDLAPIMNDFLLEKCDRMKDNYLKLIKKIDAEWTEIRDIQDIKEFAEQAKTKTWSAILFALKRNKTPSIMAWLEKAVENTKQVDHVLQLIGER